MTIDERETYIRAHDDDGIVTVEYSMMPEVARAIAQVLYDAGVRTKPVDSGFLEDSAALFRAADEADAL